MRVTQADYERADKLGTLTMERRQIVAEEFAACRNEALQDAQWAAHGAIFELCMSKGSENSAASYSEAVLSAINALEGDTDV